jgi:activator of Hsp90 ATPase-like protein
MVAIAPAIENLTFSLTQEILVRSSLAATFEALLEQMGPANEGHDGNALPMIIEAWPGGRWFRDLGDNNGHFWGQVQAIKRPTLLEIAGPLFMSYAAVSNVQYRLTEVEGGTLLTLRHTALGLIAEGHRQGLAQGWLRLLGGVRRKGEAA